MKCRCRHRRRLARSSSTTCTSRRARDVEIDLLEGRQRVAAGVPATGVMQDLALAMFTREQIDRAMPAVVVSSCGRGQGFIGNGGWVWDAPSIRNTRPVPRATSHDMSSDKCRFPALCMIRAAVRYPRPRPTRVGGRERVGYGGRGRGGRVRYQATESVDLGRRYATSASAASADLACAAATGHRIPRDLDIDAPHPVAHLNDAPAAAPSTTAATAAPRPGDDPRRVERSTGAVRRSASWPPDDDAPRGDAERAEIALVVERVSRAADPKTARDPPKRASDQDFPWSGRRDSNPRPSPWQGRGARRRSRLASLEQARRRRLVRPLRRVRPSTARIV